MLKFIVSLWNWLTTSPDDWEYKMHLKDLERSTSIVELEWKMREFDRRNIRKF